MKIQLIFTFFLFVVASSAQAKTDKAGSRDTEILGRIPGSYIDDYYSSDFDEILLPLSANSRDEREVFDRLEIKGAQELVIYEVPKDISVSVPRIYASILDELKNKDINVLFSCMSWKDECGYFLPREVLIKNRSALSSKTYHYGLGNSNNYTKSAAEFGMIAGELNHKGQKTYLLITVGKSKWDSRVGYAYEVITAGDMESIALTQAEMRADIDAQGRTVLSGLFFAKAETRLREESKPALETIAAYIKANPKHYLVVGHTDYNGNFAANQSLSRERAQAVVEALVKSYNIEQALLSPVGVGYASPATSNSTELGRAENRRVELVPESN